jgi:lipopolysaccharide/colanic/teichoic acid biosynthesis glycosyltransferase
MHRVVLLLIDLLLVAFATIAALILRDNLEIAPARLIQLLPYLIATVLAGVPVLHLAGLNRTLWRFSALVDYLRVILAVIVTVLLAMGFGFIFNRLDGVARSLPILQGLLMVSALIGVRVAMRLRHADRNRDPLPVSGPSGRQQAVLVIGLNAVTELFLRSVEEFARDRIKVAGLLGRGERHRGRLLRLYPVLGLPEELEGVLASLEVHGVLIDRLVITVRFDQLSPAAQAALLQVEKSSNIELDFFAERILLNEDGRRKARDSNAASEQDDPDPAPPPKVDLQALASRPYFRCKRAIDASLAAAALIVLAPVILLVGVMVVLDVGFPPIFWQQRPGLRASPFRLYKFRTMRAAHDRNGRRVPDAQRLSIIGRFLRRARLDELPQLINILVGEMSFVGPRPLLPADQSPAFADRLAIRPGLTGWAQVKGGRELTAADKAALDIWYLGNASLPLDLLVLLATVRMLVFGERRDQHAVHSAWLELGLMRRDTNDGPQQMVVDEANSHLRKEPRGEYEGVSRLPAARTLRAHPSARKRA